MTRIMTLNAQRLRPWLRAALVVYLLGTVALATVHQHAGPSRAADCGLCTISHTPALTAPAPQHLATGDAAYTVLAVPDHRVVEAEFSQASRSRAPPQS